MEVQKFTMQGREYALIDGEPYQRVEDVPAKRAYRKRGAAGPLVLTSGKVKGRRGMDPSQHAAMSQPSQCEKGCGRVFTWTPGRKAHERSCGRGKARRK